MTGLHPHQTGIGVLTGDDGAGGYPGTLNDRCTTVAELLGAAGYTTYLAGKWHLASEPSAWPTRRGFQHFYGTLAGGGNYYAPAGLRRDEEEVPAGPDFYYTDAITDAAVGFLRDQPRDTPFLCYVAYTAPHFPLQAREEDIARCADRYRDGWDVVRERRISRMRELGIFDGDAAPRDPQVAAWVDAPDKEWEQRRMAVYAAMVEVMDQGIGRIVDELWATDRLDDTVFVFLSDNGGSAEEIPPRLGSEPGRGPRIIPKATTDGRPVYVGRHPDHPPGGEDTFAFCGREWSHVSNAPFRMHKRWVHEGGIASPFIVHWPQGLAAGTISTATHYLPDVLPTLLEITGVPCPPVEGVSMLGSLRGGPGDDTRCQFYEHIGNAAVRRGDWKLVREHGGEWELYDVTADPTELHDLAAENPVLVKELADAWAAWAARCGVLPVMGAT